MAKTQYFVEGQCEKKLLRSFMFLESDCFISGKIEVFNFINDRMSNAYARTIKKGTHIIIVVDSDTEQTKILDENIATLKRVSCLSDKDITIVFSIKSFEDEMVYACSKIASINKMFGTKSVSEFKNKFIAHKNINAKLTEVDFHADKMWIRNPNAPFDKYLIYFAKIFQKGG